MRLKYLKKKLNSHHEVVKHLFKAIDRFIIYLMLTHALGQALDRTCWWGRVDFW